MGFLAVLLLFTLLFSLSDARHKFSTKIGVNYGLLGNNLPPPSKSVGLIKTLNAGRVKLYEPNPEILNSLSDTHLQVSIMVPNNLISSISTNQTVANDWIKSNFLPYHPATQIRYILIGNEILSQQDNQTKQTWTQLVPAMRRIKRALKTQNITKVKVGTPLAMDVLESSFPPSNGTFRSDIAEPVIKPLLHFLNKTKSFFFVDCYPYLAWTSSYPNINLDYALFDPAAPSYTDPVSNLTYTNLLDQMLDAVVFAMGKLGFRDDVRLWISETGWPNNCDVDQFGANVRNAATYNRNLVNKLTARPVKGTPARPGVTVPAFLFSLFNENRKTGPGTERHWGLFYPNGSAVYPIDLSGGGGNGGGEREVRNYYPPLPRGGNNEPYKGKVWCVAAEDASENATALASAVAYACSQGNGTCEAIRPGKECYYRLRGGRGLVARASYAFSAYWAEFRSQGGTCYFDGLAEQTTKDPSHGSCKYPSITLS